MPTGKEGFIVGLFPLGAILLGMIQRPELGQYGNLIAIAGVVVTIYGYWARRSLGSPFISGLVSGLGVTMTLLSYI